MALSNSVRKSISYCFNRSISDPVNHQPAFAVYIPKDLLREYLMPNSLQYQQNICEAILVFSKGVLCP